MEYEPPNFPAILLFENDPEFSEFLADVLGLLRYEAEPIPDFPSLLRRFERPPPPRLLITGHRKRIPGGPDVVEAVRAAGHRVPILLVGGSSNRIFDPEAWCGDGPLIQLTAPISIDDLIWVIRNALGER